MARLRPIGEAFRSKEFDQCLASLRELWAEIPESKAEVPNAYLILEYAVAIAFKLGDLDEAKAWSDLAPQFMEKRQDVGEIEFLMGKVAFERGEFDSARKKFLDANRKSKGRAFQGENPEYRRLLR
mgnify:CR=1 FL=1